MTKFLTALTASFLSAGSALAHAGHVEEVTFMDTLAHWAGHSAGAWIAVALAAGTGLVLYRRRQQKVARAARRK